MRMLICHSEGGHSYLFFYVNSGMVFFNVHTGILSIDYDSLCKMNILESKGTWIL